MMIRSRTSICCYSTVPTGWVFHERGDYNRAAAGRTAFSMAEQLTWTNLRELAGFRSDGGCAISLYLDLDPADSPTPTAVDTRVNSLLSEAEKRVEARHDELSHTEREGLKRDFARIREFFDNEFSREGARGLARVRVGQLLPAGSGCGSVPDDVHVGRTFHLAPLAQLVGRDDGAIVAFIGRERGQVFRLAPGGSRRSSTGPRTSRVGTTRAAFRRRATSGTSRSSSPST